MLDIVEIIKDMKQSNNSCLLITDPDRRTQRQIVKRARENDCIAVCHDVFVVQNPFGEKTHAVKILDMLGIKEIETAQHVLLNIKKTPRNKSRQKRTKNKRCRELYYLSNSLMMSFDAATVHSIPHQAENTQASEYQMLGEKKQQPNQCHSVHYRFWIAQHFQKVHPNVICMLLMMFSPI